MSAIPFLPVTPAFSPTTLFGLVAHPDDPLRIDFLMNSGDEDLSDLKKKEEYQKLIRYFLAALTISDDNQWVNLSPYEKDRIIPDDFGRTRMGQDLLGEDYLLKQITAALMYPEDDLGKNFWAKVYAKAYEQFGTTDIPVDAFNKVWISPDKAAVYESDDGVFILNSRLKVMLEQDYTARRHNLSREEEKEPDPSREIVVQVVRESILPVLEKEVNEGKNFAVLRQVYSSMILATWYKKSLRETFLGKAYADQGKIVGIDRDAAVNEKTYQSYLETFRKGVYSYIKEELDEYSGEVVPRKYFSGGFDQAQLTKRLLQFDPGHLPTRSEVSSGFLRSLTQGIVRVGVRLRELKERAPGQSSGRLSPLLLSFLLVAGVQAGAVAQEPVDGETIVMPSALGEEDSLSAALGGFPQEGGEAATPDMGDVMADEEGVFGQDGYSERLEDREAFEDVVAPEGGDDPEELIQDDIPMDQTSEAADTDGGKETISEARDGKEAFRPGVAVTVTPTRKELKYSFGSPRNSFSLRGGSIPQQGGASTLVDSPYLAAGYHRTTRALGAYVNSGIDGGVVELNSEVRLNAPELYYGETSHSQHLAALSGYFNVGWTLPSEGPIAGAFFAGGDIWGIGSTQAQDPMNYIGQAHMYGGIVVGAWLSEKEKLSLEFATKAAVGYRYITNNLEITRPEFTLKTGYEKRISPSSEFKVRGEYGRSRLADSFKLELDQSYASVEWAMEMAYVSSRNVFLQNEFNAGIRMNYHLNNELNFFARYALHQGGARLEGGDHQLLAGFDFVRKSKTVPPSVKLAVKAQNENPIVKTAPFEENLSAEKWLAFREGLRNSSSLEEALAPVASWSTADMIRALAEMGGMVNPDLYTADPSHSMTTQSAFGVFQNAVRGQWEKALNCSATAAFLSEAAVELGFVAGPTHVEYYDSYQGGFVSHAVAAVKTDEYGIVFVDYDKIYVTGAKDLRDAVRFYNAVKGMPQMFIAVPDKSGGVAGTLPTPEGAAILEAVTGFPGLDMLPKVSDTYQALIERELSSMERSSDSRKKEAKEAKKPETGSKVPRLPRRGKGVRRGSHDRAQSADVGGIDMSISQLALSVQRAAGASPFSRSFQEAVLFGAIEGLEPVVMEITTIDSIPALVRLQQSLGISVGPQGLIPLF